MSIDSLVGRWQAGDREALAALLERSRPVLESVVAAEVTANIDDGELAAEVLQDLEAAVPEMLRTLAPVEGRDFDQQLRERLAKEAQQRFLQRYAAGHEARVRGFVRSRLPEKLRRLQVDAEIWNDTFRIVLSKLGTFQWRGKQAFVSYILTIAKRQAGDRVKEYKARKNPEAHTKPLVCSPPGADSSLVPERAADLHTPGQCVRRKERAEILHAVIPAHLTEEEKKLIRYRYSEDKSCREIAALEGSNRMHVHRVLQGAHQKLRDALGDSSGFRSSN